MSRDIISFAWIKLCAEVLLYSNKCFNNLSCRIILKSCPRLHTLRLQQLCVPAVYPSSSLEVGPSPLRVGVGTEYELLRRVKPCGWCGHLTERGFAAVRWHCPDLCSVTLVLQVHNLPHIPLFLSFVVYCFPSRAFFLINSGCLILVLPLLFTWGLVTSNL